MRVTTLGHASLFVETLDQRILIDPCFSDTLADGALGYHPARSLRPEAIPEPTCLVVTHAHFDHFLPDTLRQLRRDVPLITARDPELLRALDALGFTEVHPIDPGQEATLGQTRLLATPSEHEEPELGILVRDPSGAFWHMADAEVSEALGQLLHREHGPIDAVSVKYQPLVRSSMGYQRNMGAAFDKREVVEWLEAACSCQPAVAFPYAAGLRFRGRHRWFNRYAFALAPAEVARLLAARLGGDGRACVMDPGDVLELGADAAPRKHAQASPFVQRRDDGAQVAWEPVEVDSLAGLEDPDQRAGLAAALEALLEGPLRDWLETQERESGPWGAEFWRDVVWQLAVHVGDGERLTYSMARDADGLSLRAGPHAHANFFTHLSGATLHEVLAGEKPPMTFWLCGDARSYEKVIGLREGRLRVPDWPAAPQDQPSDPLTFYLRRIDPPARR